MKKMMMLAVCAAALVATVGCVPVEVRVIEVVPERGEGWNRRYEHMIVEETSNKTRHIIIGRLGVSGEVFRVSSTLYN